jgi:hypothetical protein
MRIEVTWADMVDGDGGIPSRCAIARAINRMYPHYTNVSVGKNTITVNDKRKGLKYTWNTPKVAAKFIDAYDRGGVEAVAEIKFELFEHNALKQPLRKSAPGASRALRSPKAVLKSQVLEGVPAASAPKVLTPEQQRARVAKRRSA